MSEVGNVLQGSSVSESEPGLFRLRTRATTERALAALGEIVTDHGGEWDVVSGAVTMPLQAGIRHGLARGSARALPQIAGSELLVRVDDTRWQLDRSAVLLLLLGAAGGVVCVLWPFFRSMAAFVPVGLVLGVSVWLAVLSRLRHVGVGELLAQVESELEE